MTTKMTGAVRKDGGWTLIGTQVASNDATLTQTGLNSTYDTYVIGLSNMIPGTNGQNFYLRFGDSSGVDSGASDYVYLDQAYQEGSTSINITDGTATTDMRVGYSQGNSTNQALSAMIWILNPGDAGVRPTILGYWVQYQAVPEMRGGHFYGMREAVITVDRVLLLANTGIIGSGRMTVWGIAHE